MNFNYKIDHAWKNKHKQKKSQNPVVLIFLTIILFFVGFAYFYINNLNSYDYQSNFNRFKDSIYEELIYKINETIDKYLEPEINENISDFTKSCLNLTFNVKGGPGWVNRVDDILNSCLASDYKDNVKLIFVNSGFDLILNRPDSELKTEIKVNKLTNIDKNRYEVVFDGVLMLSSPFNDVKLKQNADFAVTLIKNKDNNLKINDIKLRLSDI